MNDSTRETGRTCPACGEGRLHRKSELETVEYHKQSGEIELLFSECDRCGAELADADDARANKRAMNAFKKRVDGLLTGKEIKAFRERFNLTQKLAAQLIGGGEVAFSRYESDDVVQSAPMDTALRLCIISPCNMLSLAHEKEIALPSDVMARATTDRKDRLVFLIRAHLDEELAATGTRPERQSRSAVDGLSLSAIGRTKFQQWGNA